MFTCKRASHHNGVHFFDISTSKSAPRAPCFAAFYFKLCFAPPRRALFYISTSKRSKSAPRPTCFATLHFKMRFAPQRRALFRHFNFKKIQKILRGRCASQLFASTCASRHNGVQFFISHLASWLCTRCLSEPAFRPSVFCLFRGFPTFSRTCIFSLRIFSISYLLPSDFIHIRVSSWLCSCICSYCRKFSSQTSFDNNQITLLLPCESCSGQVIVHQLLSKCFGYCSLPISGNLPETYGLIKSLKFPLNCVSQLSSGSRPSTGLSLSLAAVLAKSQPTHISSAVPQGVAQQKTGRTP